MVCLQYVNEGWMIQDFGPPLASQTILIQISGSIQDSLLPHQSSIMPIGMMTKQIIKWSISNLGKIEHWYLQKLWNAIVCTCHTHVQWRMSQELGLGIWHVSQSLKHSYDRGKKCGQIEGDGCMKTQCYVKSSDTIMMIQLLSKLCRPLFPGLDYIGSMARCKTAVTPVR